MDVDNRGTLQSGLLNSILSQNAVLKASLPPKLVHCRAWKLVSIRINSVARRIFIYAIRLVQLRLCLAVHHLLMRGRQQIKTMT